jgi:hypothetical protein
MPREIQMDHDQGRSDSRFGMHLGCFILAAHTRADRVTKSYLFKQLLSSLHLLGLHQVQIVH